MDEVSEMVLEDQVESGQGEELRAVLEVEVGEGVACW